MNKEALLDKWNKELMEWQKLRLDTADFTLKNIYSQNEVMIEQFLVDVSKLTNSR